MQPDLRPRRPVAVLLALSCARFCMGLQLQTIASLTPFLMEDLGLDYSEIGLLIGLFLAPGLALAIPGSILMKRFGHVRPGILGLILMATGCAALPLADDFLPAAHCRLVAGTGGILLNIAFLRLTAQLFQGASMNTAISVVLSSWPVGLGLGAVSYPLLAETVGWQATLWIVAALTLAVAIGVSLTVPDTARQGRGAGEAGLSRISKQSWKVSLALGSAFSCFTAGGIIYLSFAPAFFTSLDMTHAEASIAASMIVWLGLIGTPLGAWIADRFDMARIMMVSGACLSAVLIIPIALGGNPLWLSIVLGITWGLPGAPYTGMLQRVLPPTDHGLGYGIYFFLFYCGFFGFPAVAGWLLEVTGDPTMPIWFSMVLMAASVPLVAIFSTASRSRGHQSSRG
jgi:predicted MFS family arabinose efflux permease